MKAGERNGGTGLGRKLLVLGGAALLLMGAGHASAAPLIPTLSVGVGTSENPQDVATTMQLLAVLTIISLAPAILVMTTSFVRIVVVIALSLFLSFYIMAPYWGQANENGIQPYLAGQISQEQALDNIVEPMREFMFRQTRESDLALFVNLSEAPRPEGPEDVSTFTLIPAFIISELKTAFQIGFMIYIPFIVIDMIVASTLMSMGMMMLPPVMISLPFKILLFVMVDGWHLLIQSLIMSFR